jgi:serine/threonine-protein kinase HipA
MARSLHVFLHRQRIGVLTPAPVSGVEFRYNEDAPLGLPLSRSLPVIPRKRYSPQKASAFFDGLLPDGPDARLRMARSFGTLDTSTFALLSHGGLDCAGAVQFYEDDELPEASGALIPITDAEIGARLRALPSKDPRGEDEHWSVSGAQGKIALRRENGAWFIATDSEPHTHIVKPGISSIDGVEARDQSLAEHVTMTAARLLGVPAAGTEYIEFDGTPAVVVERFDRVRDDAGALVRLHQEDMCQATGVSPLAKYETDGGSGAKTIAQLLRSSIARPDDADRDVRTFAAMVTFNYLSGSPDAHAKNYALVYSFDGAMFLAPMYDAASGNMASRDGQRAFTRAAMRIGARYEFGEASPEDWLGFGNDLGLPAGGLRVREMAESIPDAFTTVIASLGASEPKKRLARSPLMARLREDCVAARRAH